MATMAEAVETTRSDPWLDRVRLKVRFPDSDSMNAALAAESTGDVQVHHARRNVISIARPHDIAAEYSDDNLSVLRDRYGADVLEDFRFDLEELDFFDTSQFGPDVVTAPSLDDVTREIGAQAAWGTNRGRNVIIAVVDTGIDGTRPEFPQHKRVSESWAPVGDDPWTDWQGHGSMCAAIAAGTRAAGGVFDGVAPEARVMACKTYFFDTELAAIYDQLADLANAGNHVIATNSYGLKTGTAPPPPQNSDFIPALEDAIAAGVTVFFSAGNYHHLAGGAPDGHEPTSIWLHKCRSDLMTVGAVKLDQSMWYYSSRGPGQHFGEPGTNAKPDVVGMTPENGRVVYGGEVRVMSEGWGTSGCCPQVAGLAALLVSKRAADGNPPLGRDELFALIRETATRLDHHPYAAGAGLIDCMAALQRV